MSKARLHRWYQQATSGEHEQGATLWSALWSILSGRTKRQSQSSIARLKVRLTVTEPSNLVHATVAHSKGGFNEARNMD